MVHQTIIPSDKTVTLSFTVPEEYIGQEVEIVAFMKQREQEDAHQSVALPGKPLSKKAFLGWVERAEEMPSITLEDAKSQWEIKKQQLIR